MDIWWTLHLKRDPASVPLARRILLGAMDSAGVDPQVAFDLGIALTEACANAVEHATSTRPDEGFQVTASISGDRLRIEVTDTGPGLPPATGASRPLTLPRCAARPGPPSAPRAAAAPAAAGPPSRPPPSPHTAPARVTTPPRTTPTSSRPAAPPPPARSTWTPSPTSPPRAAAACS
ncbi:ATP-binding protein [Kitasatospora gansuensis]